MKLIPHHFLKDVRSLRWILALWLLVVLTQVVLTFLAVQPNYQLARAAEMIGPSALWNLVNTVVWTAVIVYLIQSEPVTGATSFWLTRPIPPVVSVLSKLIFIVGLVIVPSLLPRTMDLWLFGVPSHTIYGAAWAIVYVEPMLALCVVWLATYTRSMARFWGAIGILCTLWIVFSLTLMFRSSMMPFGAESHPGLLASRFEISFWTFFGGLIVSLIIQYGFRATRKAFLLGLGGILLSIVFLFWWPFVLPRIGHPAAHPPNIKTIPLVYQLDPAKPFTWSATQLLNTSYQNAKVPLFAPPVREDGIPFIHSIETTFQPKDGAKVHLQAALEGYSYFTPDRLDWSSPLRQNNPGLTIEGGIAPDNEPVPGFMLTSEQVGKLNGQTGTLDLKITGDLLSLQKRAEIAVAGTGFARIPSALIRLIAVQNDKDALDLSVEEVGYRDMLKWKALPTVYLLVDPKNRIGIIPRKTIIKSQNSTLSGSTLSRMSAVLMLEVRTADLPENVRAGFEGNAANGLVLYVYEATSQNSFKSEIEVPHFTMRPGDDSMPASTGIMIEQYGHFDSPESPWVVDVSENKTSWGHRSVPATITSNPNAPIKASFTGNIAMAISPTNWEAHPGWFVYAQDSRYCWIFDGAGILYLDEFTPAKTTTSSLELPTASKKLFDSIPIMPPNEVFDRLPAPMQQELRRKFPAGR
jgi:hypothetical protein